MSSVDLQSYNNIPYKRVADYPLLISLSFRDADILRDEVIFANSDEDEDDSSGG
ncbi:11637_t:CDS:2 [Paraglomus brasilianum]|uniref:11637_t:CDS:1 n=1 Tax=Paraglomus brasilianum TaxID=144538 RepID=A0A9N9DHU4_9GLOM|nr:11637_t:CDS:2 [Paraglomus brasilianum]